ncbi:ATP-grasp peptide maturase system methyltransferase [Streptomyces sp. NPDC058682]|uniref:ATP-grasp peptide maturase system methyltransferase n=1 Tax=Streptomyces sp. NPDC058682 TaxID=3346596 RepID=UPI00366551D9
MAGSLAEDGALADPAWRAAVERVPRHRFVPGFYLPADERDGLGLTVWEPVTSELDYGRWLAATYTDTTLITQFDGDEPDWKQPSTRHGGAPTSSSTLPSLVVRMWADADVREGQRVLEIGTGTGYSTALACERLGSAAVTSIEVDPHRLAQAADAPLRLGYTPTLAVADGLHGYWPKAKFDRIVAACSFRAVPPALLAQTRPGGKILLTLSGWLYGYARVLLTVSPDRTAEGQFLDGTVSFMSARTRRPCSATPTTGPPEPATTAASRGTRRPGSPLPPKRRSTCGSSPQSAVPDAQMTTVGEVVHLVDVVTGSAATLTPDDIGGWAVREGGPLKLWERIEHVLGAYDAAGRPGPESFTLHVYDSGQHLRHPQMPGLPLPRP